MSDFVKSKARPEVFTLDAYVPGKPIDEVKRELGLDDIIKMASNENPLGPSPQAVEAVTASLPHMHIYPDANCFDLKQRLAAVYKLESENFLLGNGSDEVLTMLATAFLEPGDQIVYGSPTFSQYKFVAKVMGAETAVVPLHNYTYDLDAILKAINDNTKMVFICNPNNPTGTIVDQRAMDRFMDIVSDQVLVVIDEAYAEYVENPAFVSGLKYVQEGRNVVVLRTFSKIYGLAALRMGYGMTSTAIAQTVERIAQPFNVNSFAQVGARAAIDDHEHVQRSRRLNAAGKHYLYSQFQQMGLKYVPTEANFIFVDTGRDSQDIFKALLNMGIIIRTGDVFGHPGFIRVTIGTAAENERFIKSLKQVLD